MNFWDEIWGCVKYIKIPYDTVWNMPVYNRKMLIYKHNQDVSEQNNDENNRNNTLESLLEKLDNE